MLLRSDSGGATHGFIDALRESGVSFSVRSDVTEAVRQAVAAVPETGWRNAVEADGDRRDGAQVAELQTWTCPAGRRAPPPSSAANGPTHGASQLSFFDADGWRITCFITDQPDADTAALERRHRAHARVEDRIRCGKATGLAHLSSSDFQRTRPKTCSSG